MGTGRNRDVDTKTAEEVRVSRFLQRAREMLRPKTRSFEVIVNDSPMALTVTRAGMGPLTTNPGSFWQFLFLVDDPWREYHVLVSANLNKHFDPEFDPGEPVLLRIDSGCVTGQVYWDLTCDCRDQLRVAMTRIQKPNQGLIIAIPRQDGRGKGLPFKLATLYLQQAAKFDTYDAAAALAENSEIDVRTYGGALAILQFFKLRTAQPIRFMTNNPLKLAALAENGYGHVERFPIRIRSNKHTAKHLAAKANKLGHLL